MQALALEHARRFEPGKPPDVKGLRQTLDDRRAGRRQMLRPIFADKQRGLWTTCDPNPFAPDGQNRSVGQFLWVGVKELLEQRDALRRRDIG